jgi:predicted O-methyltransferase YrrM
MRLQYLDNFKFIGDLSLQDADVLCSYGRQAKRILEFGVGGSTQLFAQCKPSLFYSVETDQEWIGLTRKRLDLIPDKTNPVFFLYNNLPEITNGQKYDLIFVDGVDDKRLDFAIKTWNSLDVGGVMIFHDTKRPQDFKNAAWVAQLYFNEISRMYINATASNGKSSNLTVLVKKAHEPYVNWNYEENKPLSSYSVPGTESMELWSQS